MRNERARDMKNACLAVQANCRPHNVEKEKWALKPMNCPGHCLIFGYRDRSYRELPIRLAEFGTVHQNVGSRALGSLWGVKSFVQDDGHVFCMPSQIEREINAAFDFMQHIYGLFGFEFELSLSTRPENYIGSVETWNYAEDQLKLALEKQYSGKWKVNPGAGAFYGPKINISIKDILGRSIQCGSIQLDFQLPERFKLKYRSDDRNELSRPVILHRAILGSIEQFFAIITEQFSGKWPFWLSPRQVLVISVAARYNAYAAEISDRLSSLGLYVDIDNEDVTFPEKIDEQYNFIIVVGQEELDSRSVNIRNRDDVESKSKGEMVRLDKVVEQLVDLKKSRRLSNRLV